MSETTPHSKGPAPARLTPDATEPALIPADQVKPEDIGTLALEYRDGRPVIVVSGGKFLPAGIEVVDGAGKPVSAYKISVRFRELEVERTDDMQFDRGFLSPYMPDSL
ncbi:hypothetical protein N4G70_35935 [Streptomyces sp. ASQP_92]|uniref:hypothetical protein n=1 Tax=Streptomyces sp. ASQP_92 TaxID=2979116 RepID=UPI0021BE5B18|nr:hypothetical protein [Streptomyces sp. ASQP_92]MCT9094192.1 hypothetical protein [Streptomyces sp. ASQP_92]